MYDIVIVGSGIAGLNIYNSLIESGKYCKMLLIERNNYIGGRVYTVNKKIGKINHKLEAGAGRFNKNHKLLIDMIKKFKLHKKITKINSSDMKFVSYTNRYKDNKLITRLPYYYLDLIASRRFNNEMRKYTLKTWLYTKLDKKIVRYLIDSYPYKDMFKTNAYDAMVHYKKNMNINQDFFILRDGLYQIVTNLVKNINKNNGTIKLNTDCKSVKQIDNYYTIKCSTNNSTYTIDTKKVILAVQKPTLQKLDILKPVIDLINSVSITPLLRVYFIFDVPKNGVWFKNIKKVLTDTPITYFIPISYTNGSVMISYSDENRARFLNNMEKNNSKDFIKFIIDECKKLFNLKSIPKPIWYKMCYWDKGVAAWKPGVNSNKVSKQILRPLKRKNLFICGENYSRDYQSWIEGALETSNKVLDKLL